MPLCSKAAQLWDTDLCGTQGNTSEELPEAVLGTVRFKKLDLNDATPLEI